MDIILRKKQNLVQAFKTAWRSEKKILFIVGGGIGIVGALGLGVYLTQKGRKSKKVQIAFNYIQRMESAFKRNKWDNAEQDYQLSLLSSDIKDYVIKNKEKFYKLNSLQKELVPGAKCEELFQELLEQVIKEMDDKTGEIKYDLISDSELISTNGNNNQPLFCEGVPSQTSNTSKREVNPCNWWMIVDSLLGGVLQQIIELLKLAQTDASSFLFLKKSFCSMFSRVIVSNSKGVQVETTYLEILFQRISKISLKNQEKLLSILQILTDYDAQFLHFIQLSIAKNIISLSIVDPFFLLEKNKQKSKVLSNNRRNSDSSEIVKNKNTIKSKKRYIISPLMKFLSSQAISDFCLDQMICSRYVQKIYELATQLCQKQGADLVSVEMIIETMFTIIHKITSSSSQANKKLFEANGGVISNMLLKALSFQESAETTSTVNNNLVNQVNWVASNFDIVLARMRISHNLKRAILNLNKSHQNAMSVISYQYMTELRWTHQIKRDDQLRGCSQLEIDLSITSLYLNLILSHIKEIPSKEILNDYFDGILQFPDPAERAYILNSTTTTLSSFLFMKEIFYSMLEKSLSQTNSLILQFNEFKQSFYYPQEKGHDEIILALQFAILLGGAQCLCDEMVAGWQRDVDDYESQKIYMSSDIAFFLQLLENDTCLLNVIGKWDESNLNFESKIQFRQATLKKVQKLVINYLQVFNSCDRENLKEYLKNQLSKDVLDNEGILDVAIDSVTQLSVKLSSRSISSSICHSSRYSQSQKQNVRVELQEKYQDKFFSSLFNNNIPMLIRLLQAAQNKQLASNQPSKEDFQIESKLDPTDKPLLYLQQVRRELLRNINLHSHFYALFIQNETVLLERLRVVCRILHYIFDVIEEGLAEASITKKLQENEIKSLLVLYIFDPTIRQRLKHIQNLMDEDGELIALHFLQTIQNILLRRQRIKESIKNIFQGSDLSQIVQ